MKKILIGMRGGIGDIVLYSSVLIEFFRKHKDCEFICGTSLACLGLAKSIPGFSTFIPDFRPRFVRQQRDGSFLYKDKRSGFRLDDIADYYCLDHPYRELDPVVARSTHIIEVAAQILKVRGYSRKATVFLTEANRKYAISALEAYPRPIVVLAPTSAQKTKVPPNGLLNAIAESFKEAGFSILCAVPPDVSFSIEASRLSCSILDLAAVVSRSDYYVGLDSGVSHIASSFPVPMTTLHIGYPVARCGVLSDFANVMRFDDRNIPESEWPRIIEQINLHAGQNLNKLSVR